MIDAQIYSRETNDKDVQDYSISLKRRLTKLQKDLEIEQNVIKNNTIDQLERTPCWRRRLQIFC